MAYTLDWFADNAGRGATPPPEPDPVLACCAGCGTPIPPDRTYCGEERCRRRWVRRGSGARDVDALPLIERYSA